MRDHNASPQGPGSETHLVWSVKAMKTRCELITEAQLRLLRNLREGNYLEKQSS